MERKSIAGKMTCVALCVFFSLSQMSCSLWKKGETERESKRNEAKVFVSNIRTARGNPDSHYLLACYYQERGKHNDAIGEFNKVIAIDPLYVKAYNGLGVSYSELEEHEKSVNAFLTALKINPELDYVHNNIGYSYLLLGNLDAAIDAFKKAAALNNGVRRIHNNLGMAYLMTGDAEKAREEFAMGGSHALAVYNMARLYYQNDMFYEAREHFARALDMNPSLAGARKGWEASDTLYKISQALSEKADNAGNSMIAGGKVHIEGSLPERADTANRVDSMKWLQKVEIEISNGNGVRHMAKNMGSYLEKRGFKVVRLSNANHFKYRRGNITYSKHYYDAATAVARKIPHMKELRMIEKPLRDKVKIKVLVGKDLIPYKKYYKDDRS